MEAVSHAFTASVEVAILKIAANVLVQVRRGAEVRRAAGAAVLMRRVLIASQCYVSLMEMPTIDMKPKATVSFFEFRQLLEEVCSTAGRRVAIGSA